MTNGDPLGPAASMAGDAARRLDQAVAQADSEWADGARRQFDQRHLDRIRKDANGLASGLDQLAERCRRTASGLGLD